MQHTAWQASLIHGTTHQRNDNSEHSCWSARMLSRWALCFSLRGQTLSKRIALPCTHVQPSLMAQCMQLFTDSHRRGMHS